MPPKNPANCANVKGLLVRLCCFVGTAGRTFVSIVFSLEKGVTFSSAGDTDELDEMLVVESRDDTEELFCRLRNTCCKGMRVKDIGLAFHPHRYISLAVGQSASSLSCRLLRWLAVRRGRGGFYGVDPSKEAQLCPLSCFSAWIAGIRSEGSDRKRAPVRVVLCSLRS